MTVDGTACARQHSALAELAHVVREVEDLETILTVATGLVASALEVDFSEILESHEDGAEFRLRAGIGWRCHCVGRTVIRPREGESGYSLALAGPVVVDDYGKDVRFFVCPLLLEHGVISGVRVPIGWGRHGPWGLLGAHTRHERSFHPHETAFMKAAADMLAEAIEAAELRQAVQRGHAEIRGSSERLHRAW